MDWLTTYWQPIVIGILFGFVLGWLLTWLPMRSRGKKAGAQIADLQARLSVSDQALANAQQQALSAETQLHGDLDAMRQAYAELEQQYSILHADAENTAASLARAEHEVAATAETLASKNAALDEAYLRIARLQNEVGSYQNLVVSTQTELEAAQHNIAMLGTRNEELEAKLHDVRGGVANEMALMTSTMLRMKEQELADLRGRLSAITHELESLKSAARGAA